MEKSKLIACHDCDLLIRLPSQIDIGQKVCCPRCHTPQFTMRKDPIDKSIAITLSALILLIIAISFPFLSMESNGATNTISLFESPIILFADRYYLMAAIVLGGVIVLPAMYLISLLALLMPLQFFHAKKASIFHAKLISSLHPWVMADVFVIAVLVALIKLIDMADIILDLAFWAYIAFTLLFVMTTSIVSKRQLWHWVTHGN